MLILQTKRQNVNNLLILVYKKLIKKIQKPIDKSAILWYNIYIKGREQIPNKRKRGKEK